MRTAAVASFTAFIFDAPVGSIFDRLVASCGARVRFSRTRHEFGLSEGPAAFSLLFFVAATLAARV
jgi:hypothetical protein